MKLFQPSESLTVGFLLALTGGLLDAYSYLNRGEVFATAETGNIVLMGINLAQQNWSGALHYLLPVAVMAAVALLFLLPRGLLNTWWGLLLFVVFLALGFSGAWFNAHIFYNDKDNQPHDG